MPSTVGRLGSQLAPQGAPGILAVGTRDQPAPEPTRVGLRGAVAVDVDPTGHAAGPAQLATHGDLLGRLIVLA